MSKKRCRDVSSFHSLILLWLWLVTTYPAIADDNGTLTDKSISGLPAFQARIPITLTLPLQYHRPYTPNPFYHPVVSQAKFSPLVRELPHA